MTFPVLTAQQRYQDSGLSVLLSKSPTLLKAAFCLCSLELNTGPASEDSSPQLSATVWDPGVVMEP